MKIKLHQNYWLLADIDALGSINNLKPYSGNCTKEEAATAFKKEVEKHGRDNGDFVMFRLKPVRAFRTGEAKTTRSLDEEDYN